MPKLTKEKKKMMMDALMQLAHEMHLGVNMNDKEQDAFFDKLHKIVESHSEGSQFDKLQQQLSIIESGNVNTGKGDKKDNEIKNLLKAVAEEAAKKGGRRRRRKSRRRRRKSRRQRRKSRRRRRKSHRRRRKSHRRR